MYVCVCVCVCVCVFVCVLVCEAGRVCVCGGGLAVCVHVRALEKHRWRENSLIRSDLFTSRRIVLMYFDALLNTFE